MRPLTVLQVLPALASGGVERGTLEIAMYLKAQGHVPLVASAGGAWVRELQAAGITHLTLPLKSKNPARIWANIGALEEVIRTHKVDIVHARSRAPAWSAYFAAKRCGVPFVTTYHAAYKNNFPFKHTYNSVMAKGVQVIAISDYIRRLVLAEHHLPEARVPLILRGFEPERFDVSRVDLSKQADLRAAWNLPQGVPVIMCPGRVSPIKGQDVLLRALALLGDLPFVCVIAGGDQGRNRFTAKLKALAAELGLAERVLFTGPLTIDGQVMSLADVVVMPTLVPEAFGRVLVEAQAMEKLVISSDIGGVPETMLPGKTGWLTKAGDAQGIADALRTFFALSPNERRSRERAARAHVLANFTTEKMCAQTLEVYQSVVS